MKTLANKIAVITGAAKGIGQAVAVRFAAEGARLALIDLDQESLDETVQIIKDKHGHAVEVIALKADVSNETEVNDSINQVMNRFNGIDIMINNAGIQPPKKPFYEIPLTEWEQTFAVNIKSMFMYSKAVAPHFINKQSGNIVNTASTCESVVWEGSLHYITSKGSVRHLTEAMAMELAPYKIRVNAVSPGVVDTPLNKDTLSTKEAREKHEQLIPLRKVSVPEDLAGAYAFLASDRSEYITGHVLVVDGGFSLT